MKSLLHSTLTIVYLFPIYAIAQSDGDYRSVATGNWNVVATWERYNGGTLSGETN